MASIYGSKSKSSTTKSIPPQDEPSINLAGSKLRDRNAEESWALLEDLALYDNEIQCLMEAHLTPKKPIQVNKIPSSCKICCGPYDTQYCIENPKQAFVDHSSSLLVSNFMASQDVILSKFEADFKQQQSEMTNKIDTVLKAITDRMVGALPSDTVKTPKLNVNTTTSVLSARSYPTEDPQCSTHIHGSINTITIHPKQQNDSRDGMAEEEEQEREGDLKDTNTIACIEERRDTPLLERKDITPVCNLGSNKDFFGKGFPRQIY
ncbi:hypothetical protein Tco_1550669 [Tanacetum coccineum]